MMFNLYMLMIVFNKNFYNILLLFSLTPFHCEPPPSRIACARLYIFNKIKR
uniref:DekiORF43 n=1 Tax=Dendrolimus kikuchii nucleopolyhedrovirus TaxID=1219875 RepID=V9LSM7_9ABAC|nr:DekiORF43 [Dendrolimus kikuchii nucleopolyhedrovirus]